MTMRTEKVKGLFKFEYGALCSSQDLTNKITQCPFVAYCGTSFSLQQHHHFCAQIPFLLRWVLVDKRTPSLLIYLLFRATVPLCFAHKCPLSWDKRSWRSCPLAERTSDCTLGTVLYTTVFFCISIFSYLLLVLLVSSFLPFSVFPPYTSARGGAKNSTPQTYVQYPPSGNSAGTASQKEKTSSTESE